MYGIVKIWAEIVIILNLDISIESSKFIRKAKNAIEKVSKFKKRM